MKAITLFYRKLRESLYDYRLVPCGYGLKK